MRNESLNNNIEALSNQSKSNLDINQKTITCWNCSNSFYVDSSQEVEKCPKCNKYNRVPKISHSRNINYFKGHLDNLENNVTRDSSEKIITCPFCYTKNLFHNEADELICYKCAKNINQGFETSFQINTFPEETIDKKIVGWRIVPSQQTFITPPTPLPPSPITPSPQSNTDYLLTKILKSLKKQKNYSEGNNNMHSQIYNPFPVPSFIPYPVVDYYSRSRYINDDDFDRGKNYINRSTEIRYVPIKTEIEKPKNNGYKITIRKKKGNGKEISKSTIFEKVFYLK
jgi:hypothetical protein